MKYETSISYFTISPRTENAGNKRKAGNIMKHNSTEKAENAMKHHSIEKDISRFSTNRKCKFMNFTLIELLVNTYISWVQIIMTSPKSQANTLSNIHRNDHQPLLEHTG